MQSKFPVTSRRHPNRSLTHPWQERSVCDAHLSKGGIIPGLEEEPVGDLFMEVIINLDQALGSHTFGDG